MILSHLTRLLCIGVILTGAHDLLSCKTVSAAPAPKSNRTLLLGVWEVTKSEDGTPPTTTVEFTRDGKVKIATKVGDETLNLDGTYKLEDDKVTVTIKDPKEGEELTDTLTIIKLTEKVLITKDQKGKTDEFKKKK
ncbi:MAG: lipocalin family protein [Gemmataceae bacterium]